MTAPNPSPIAPLPGAQRPRRSAPLALGGALLCASLVGGCSNPEGRTSADVLPPPLQLAGSAYEAAAATRLYEVRPLDLPGLVHVYHLSNQVICGAEPAGEEGLRRIAQLGVQTILSVDGKVPDAETAERYGMRYVHVPTQYTGMTDEELLKITKTFRELEGPFYVHCYHGKHRGPAAAAIGRVAIDGVARDRAIAEMRQWCETSSKYEGLYSTVAQAEIPTAAETAAFEFDFTSAHRFDGFRSTMVEMTRKWDLIKDAEARAWQPDAAHPDVVALEEASQLHQLIAASRELPEAAAWNDDFRTWLDDSFRSSAELVDALSARSMAAAEADDASDWQARAAAAFESIGNSCVQCHDSYRN